MAASKTIRARRGPILAVLAVMVLAACSADEVVYVERDVEDLYNGAMNNLLTGETLAAAQEFDEVERQHPYSIWATKAQLMASFARYDRQEYDDAIIGLDRFIQLHPGNPDVAYAYYLRALSYYEQIADVGRDQRTTALALDALDDVVRRFPGTDYARDSRLKRDLAQDHLAGKEMEIGRFYLRRGQYLAAINRFTRVVEEFDTTTHAPEALHRIAESYTALGIEDEARKAAAVLGYNYPGSEWYVDSYELVEEVKLRDADGGDDGLLSRLWPF